MVGSTLDCVPTSLVDGEITFVHINRFHPKHGATAVHARDPLLRVLGRRGALGGHRVDENIFVMARWMAIANTRHVSDAVLLLLLLCCGTNVSRHPSSRTARSAHPTRTRPRWPRPHVASLKQKHDASTCYDARWGLLDCVPGSRRPPVVVRATHHFVAGRSCIDATIYSVLKPLVCAWYDSAIRVNRPPLDTMSSLPRRFATLRKQYSPASSPPVHAAAPPRLPDSPRFDFVPHLWEEQTRKSYSVFSIVAYEVHTFGAGC